MGGEIDPAWFPMLFAIYGIDDPELFLVQLIAIREHVARTDKRE